MGYLRHNENHSDILIFKNSMGKLAFVVLFLILPFSNGALRDMVETGYVQDPDLVGKLPMEFEADMDDIELERSIDDDIEEDSEEGSVDEERSLNEDLELLDPQMRSEIEDYCNTDAGKTDEALCSRISSRAAKGKPKQKRSRRRTRRSQKRRNQRRLNQRRNQRKPKRNQRRKLVTASEKNEQK